MSIHQAGPVAFLSQSQSAVFFSKGTTPTSSSKQTGTASVIRKVQTDNDIAFWGEDNRFPQNIEQHLAYCGIAKAGLDWKARMLYGNGIVAGTTALKEVGDGKFEEIFTPLPDSNKVVHNFLNDRRLFRFWLEYLQDWVWFGNCFPEVILSNDAKRITGLVHQESCDSRFSQMDENGCMRNIFLSKLWGASENQYARFDPKKPIKGLRNNPQNIAEFEKNYLKKLDCIDMYDPIQSLKGIAAELQDKDGLKSAILPTNYPSPNKTYYQVPAWDGARLSGWIEIASKIPSMLKALFTKAFSIRYHIEVPQTFFIDRYGVEGWAALGAEGQAAAKSALLKEMDDALSGDENAYKSFITFYGITPQDKKEYGKIIINEVKDPTNIDKELISQSAADIQTLVAMGIDPTIFGAGTIGTGQQRSGGSDKRESYNIYVSGLHLERQVLLEPLYVVRDYNREVGGMSEWAENIQFRMRDTVMTTLDKGHGQTNTNKT